MYLYIYIYIDHNLEGTAENDTRRLPPLGATGMPHLSIDITGSMGKAISLTRYKLHKSHAEEPGTFFFGRVESHSVSMPGISTAQYVRSTWAVEHIPAPPPPPLVLRPPPTQDY